MKIYLISFAVLFITIAAMAVGVIFSNRELKGSCGGLGKIMGEDCMFCDKKDECDKKKKQQASIAEMTLE